METPDGEISSPEGRESAETLRFACFEQWKMIGIIGSVLRIGARCVAQWLQILVLSEHNLSYDKSESVVNRNISYCDFDAINALLRTILKGKMELA